MSASVEHGHAPRGAVLRLSPNGGTCYVPSRYVLPPAECKRDRIKGWTRQSASRHVRWLHSVDSTGLDGLHGYAVTLTVRDTPGTAVLWHEMRRAWWSGVRRSMGAVLWHWVVEWQRRGVPHLHIAVYFRDPLTVRERAELGARWVKTVGKRGGAAVSWAQYVKPITGAAGWAKYCAKHSGRSASHCQREGMPPGWQASGRMWGHSGPWVTRTVEVVLTGPAVSHVRRGMRSWRVADTRRREPVGCPLHRSPVRVPLVRDGVLVRRPNCGLVRPVCESRGRCGCEGQPVLVVACERCAVVVRWRREMRMARRSLAGGVGVAAVRSVRQWLPEAGQGRLLDLCEDLGADSEVMGWSRRDSDGVVRGGVDRTLICWTGDGGRVGESVVPSSSMTARIAVGRRRAVRLLGGSLGRVWMPVAVVDSP